MKRGLLIAALLATTACSGQPDVDWDRYPTGVRVKIDIDNLAAAEDCQALGDRLGNAEESDLRAYIEDSMEEAGC